MPAVKEPPDHVRFPVEFLLHHGWEPVDDPRLPHARWLDTTRPDKATDRPEFLMNTRDNKTGRKKEIKQVVHVPGKYDLEFSTADAVGVQVDRLAEAEKRARKNANR